MPGIANAEAPLLTTTFPHCIQQPVGLTNPQSCERLHPHTRSVVNACLYNDYAQAAFFKTFYSSCRVGGEASSS